MGSCWAILGPCWASVGPSWGHVGPMLGPCWAILGLCWAVLGHLGAMLGLCWVILRPAWAYVGPMLAQPCPYLSPMLTHVAHILVDVGPILTSRPSRCPIFRSGPRPKTQNHEKPTVFPRRQDQTGRRRRPQNPVKKRCFLNTFQNTL